MSRHLHLTHAAIDVHPDLRFFRLEVAALGVLVGAVSGFDLGYEIGKDAGMRGAR